MKKIIFWCYLKMLLYGEEIVELIVDLATSGGITWIVAISLLKFGCMIWKKRAGK
ncbi:hypothetical protein C7820_4354 [Paenibacillus sp. VMFN-D1]|nr:hypothetical protein C7820_4354 [Paenibacillus sp. VMFN-D1]